jgi:hypothetical protein
MYPIAGEITSQEQYSYLIGRALRVLTERYWGQIYFMFVDSTIARDLVDQGLQGFTIH